MSEFSGYLANGFRLQCPGCRSQPLFRSFFDMHQKCPGCGYVFEREVGYFVGAIYINIIATFAIILSGAGLMAWYFAPSLMTMIAVWCIFSVLFPLFFFRYSRSVWLNLDHFFSKKPSLPGETGKTAVSKATARENQ